MYMRTQILICLITCLKGRKDLPGIMHTLVYINVTIVTNQVHYSYTVYTYIIRVPFRLRIKHLHYTCNKIENSVLEVTLYMYAVQL